MGKYTSFEVAAGLNEKSTLMQSPNMTVSRVSGVKKLRDGYSAKRGLIKAPPMF